MHNFTSLASPCFRLTASCSLGRILTFHHLPNSSTDPRLPRIASPRAGDREQHTINNQPTACMAKRLSLLAAVISVCDALFPFVAWFVRRQHHLSCRAQINICSVSSELRFDPAGLPVAVLTAGHTEILQQTIHLRNTGSEPASVRVVAQCDENLR